MNLKDRLRFIKTSGRVSAPQAPPQAAPLSVPAPVAEIRAARRPSPAPGSKDTFSGWEQAGDFVISRMVFIDGAAHATAVPGTAHAAANLRALVPDAERFFVATSGCAIPGITFFDLETTGLSGGAGTLAFLAAFGKSDPDNARLAVTQYLLLDHSGEPLFLEKCRENLSGLVVSYNGKSFDSQIIKNRCVMNALPPPFYHHADLVHPARYLWKRKIPSCRQKDIEEMILGINREDDLPGSFAPDAWFTFLKTGEKTNLLKTCAHNLSDIAGLAGIWGMFVKIAESPLTAPRRYQADSERLALRYRGYVRRHCREGHPVPQYMEETATRLLEAAAAEGSEIARLLWERRYGKQLF